MNSELSTKPLSFASLLKCGLILVTLIYKWLNRQIVVSVLVIGMSVSTVLLPSAAQLWHLYLCILVYGVGAGAWNAANNVILIEIWRNKSPAILLLCQFFYGIGTILGPLLSKNYVIGNMVCPGVYRWQCGRSSTSADNTSFATFVFNASDQCSEQCLTYDRRPVLRIPFLVGGLLLSVGKI